MQSWLEYLAGLYKLLHPVPGLCREHAIDGVARWHVYHIDLSRGYDCLEEVQRQSTCTMPEGTENLCY